MSQIQDIPAWLQEEESYNPPKDKDAFIGKSILSITGVLAHFRLDDGKPWKFSPSAPAKLIFGFACILLSSLSSNFIFTMIVLAGLLLRMIILSPELLKRVISVALLAAGMTFVLMLPATLLGQPQSALTLSIKVFVSVGIAMTVALSTPFNQLTAALRVFHVPNIFIMTIDLALKNIVSLGQVAVEMLTALKIRSVGKNEKKGKALGGIGGMLFLKSKDASEATFEAMSCRGFEGEYVVPKERMWKAIDLAWLALLLVLIVLFVYFQGAM